MTRAADLDLSLVLPVHNELGSLREAIESSLVALAKSARSYELIVVDDGSDDGSREEILAAEQRAPEVRAVLLRRRFGKGAALAAGFARARGRIVATLDADLQEDPAELPVLLAGIDEGYDLVTGWRRHRRDSWSKRLQSSLFHLLVRALTGRRHRDINCGFKAMSREVATELELSGGRFRFIPLVAEWWGFRTTEREVSHRPRPHGRSHYGGGRFPHALIDLITILCLIRYHSRPGHLFIQLGTLSGLAGFGICGFLAGLRIATGSIDFRYPLLVLGVLLLLAGIQLVGLGFLAEWLFYTHRSSERSYRVDDGLPPRPSSE